MSFPAVFEAVVVVVLEFLGLLAVAAGATLGLLPVIGWSSLAVGGVLLIGGVLLASKVGGSQ